MSIYAKGYLIGRMAGQTLAGLAGGFAVSAIFSRVGGMIQAARLGRPRGGSSPRPAGQSNAHYANANHSSPRPRLCPAGNSFVPGTLVLMGDGTTKAIEEVRVGDWVWAEDPETGVRGARPVIDLIVGHGEKELIDVEIDGQTITATAGHPIWLDCCSKWVDAEDLQAGEHVRTAAGYTVTIDSVQGYTVPEQSVYNLTVSGLHTYFVLAGDEAVLVHNTTCPPQGGPHGQMQRPSGDGFDSHEMPPGSLDPFGNRPQNPAVQLPPDAHRVTPSYGRHPSDPYPRTIQQLMDDNRWRDLAAREIREARRALEQTGHNPALWNPAMREYLDYLDWLLKDKGMGGLYS